MRANSCGSTYPVLLRYLVLAQISFKLRITLPHRPLLGGHDEPETLSYQIALFGPISADVRHPF